jgi:PAS domain S-box-containing protein
MERPLWLRYGAGIIFVGIALVVRAALDPFLGDAHPFPFFLGATAVAAWYGGLGPALMALVSGYLAADWFFTPPRYTLWDWSAHGVFSLAVYVINGLLISMLIHAAQRANRLNRQRAAQLQHERERFRTTLASIGDAVITTDTGGLVTFMNAVAERVTGWKHQEVCGKPLDEFFKIHNELTGKPVDNPVAKVLREGAIVGLCNHTVLVIKDGREIPIDDSAAPIRDVSGELVGTILVFRDVTEQRAAELATRRLASIVENSDDAIIAKDLRGIVTTWNKSAERIFGYRAAEMLGKSITTLIPADRPNEEQEIQARLERGERVDHFETIRQTKDGREIEVSLTISPIKDAEGKIVGASKIARDITERKKAEADLRASNARNTAILESSLDAIIVIDQQSKILEFNPAAEKIFGFHRSQVIGQPMAEWIIPERFRARHYQGMANYLAKGEGPVLRKRIELPALRASGEEFPVELAIVPIPGTQPAIFTGYLRDLTEMKRAEADLLKAREDLIQANKSLENKVAERTASLHQSLKSMETVLYTIAHDLRGPNRAMQGFAQLLASEHGSKLDEEGRSYITRISNAALKNDTLICDLLEYGRLAHAELPMSNVELGQSVQKVVQDLQQQISSKNATIDLGQKWPTVWANESVLSQIITNLLTNALKFVAPGVAPRVRIWAEQIDGQNAAVRLHVDDNGIGIPPEIQGRLFQPFQRGTADPKYHGTGMGLAIVQKGAERLGGKVGLSSMPGKGSSFWMELLAAPPVKPAGAREKKDRPLR